MKLCQKIGFLVFIFVLILSFLRCTSTKETMKIGRTIELAKGPNTEVYYQSWIAGIKGGGSGINLFINKSVVENRQLITAYFKGRVVDFDNVEEESNMFVACFNDEVNQKHDINMAADAINEYGNKTPVENTTFLFKLESNEAVVSYLENNRLKYLKLINIPKKESLAYPSTPRD